MFYGTSDLLMMQDPRTIKVRPHGALKRLNGSAAGEEGRGPSIAARERALERTVRADQIGAV